MTAQSFQQILVGLCACSWFVGAPAFAVLVAQDDYETSTGVAYGGTSGTGFGAHTDLGGSGGIFHTTGSRKISGAGSLGSFSSGTQEAWGRTVVDTSAYATNPLATYDISMRFDIPNSSANFKGFNVKTALGASFNADELISVGMTQPNGNNKLLITGAAQTTLDFGTGILGAIIDVHLQWDTTTGAYSLSASKDGGSPLTASGSLQGISWLPGAVGFTHGDAGGGGNDIFFDNLSLQAVPEVSSLLAIPTATLVGAAIMIFRRRRFSWASQSSPTSHGEAS